MRENWKILTIQFGGYNMLNPTASEIHTIIINYPNLHVNNCDKETPSSKTDF